MPPIEPIRQLSPEERLARVEAVRRVTREDAEAQEERRRRQQEGQRRRPPEGDEGGARIDVQA